MRKESLEVDVQNRMSFLKAGARYPGDDEWYCPIKALLVPGDHTNLIPLTSGLIVEALETSADGGMQQQAVQQQQSTQPMQQQPMQQQPIQQHTIQRQQGHANQVESTGLQQQQSDVQDDAIDMIEVVKSRIEAELDGDELDGDYWQTDDKGHRRRRKKRKLLPDTNVAGNH